ncbi:HNH endonuclease family protein [Amycolatopsis sacchari]|uniref:HNH endonuclease family protein n=1 Tax=Amycolatopsis sacchari TaxID=115433 RepID=UPI003EB89463
MKKSWWSLAVLAVVAVLVAVWQSGAFQPHVNPPANAAPAGTELAELVVQPRTGMGGYSREKFPHWATVSGECDTRETVLKRDGQDVRTDAQCRPTSGTWHSPYDGGTWTKASDVDIDHTVPLGQAWESGAAKWTNDRRKEFANDLTRPQLRAVTDNVNQAKGDKAPDEWRPPLQSDWCAYATDWITVKHYYQLTVTEAEKAALTDMLNHC